MSRFLGTFAVHPGDRVIAQKRLEFILRNYKGRVRDDFARMLRENGLYGEDRPDPRASKSFLLTSYARGDDQYLRRVTIGLLATDNHCDGTLNPGWLHFHSEGGAVVALCGGCGGNHAVAQAMVDYLGLMFVRFSTFSRLRPEYRPIEHAQFAHVLAGQTSVEIAVAIGEYIALRKEMGLPPVGLS